MSADYTRGLLQALERLGYVVTRQTGSHIRTTTERGGEHHVTIPAHDPLSIASAETAPVTFREQK